MAKIAILYGTTEGQTGKIAQRIASTGRQHGHQVEIVHLAEVDASFDVAGYDGVMVGASIHEGSHQRYVYRWLEAHQAALASRPTAAFTVCLAIRSVNEAERAEARAFSGLYQQKTGWKPDVSEVFAGALMYGEYNWLVRMVMKAIARHEGGSTDTSHNTEYTDWTEVDRFAEAFFSRPELNRRGEARALP
jgi:menaquinone-dependent protoporphyrinogen oxidase